jgi:hypothetical protein
MPRDRASFVVFSVVSESPIITASFNLLRISSSVDEFVVHHRSCDRIRFICNVIYTYPRDGNVFLR